MGKLLAIIIVILSCFFSGVGTEASILHFSGVRPANLGVHSGKLLPCPPSPNCVSSQSTDPLHSISPLSYTTDREAALAKLGKIIAKQPDATIITEKAGYLYSEFTSQFMGFVDDVEFYAPTDRSVIEVRSASRLGESDLGVNRSRVEKLRDEFTK